MKTKIVAEISANHCQDFNKACELVISAKKCGASHVKLQTYKPETMTLNLDKDSFKISKNHKLWGGKSLFNLYMEAQTPWSWHKDLFDLANEVGIDIFSSPFDKTAVDFLEDLNVKMYKIASMESGDIPLIKYISSTKKPIIASTGASTISEIDDMVEAIYSQGNYNLTLLLCTSAYPTPLEQVNLNRFKLLSQRYGTKMGLSDHTIGNASSLAAVAMGAEIIEKHFILNKQDDSPDAKFSINPPELKNLTQKILEMEMILGKTDWDIQLDESESRRLRRSLIITQNVNKGDKISEYNVKSLRPNIGIEPKYFETVLGYRFKSDFKLGDPLTWDKISYDI